MSAPDAATTSPRSAPRVSVVMPAFNAARYIDEALSSLRAQTLTDLEIIVIDDGSTDGTGAIAARHEALDARVRVTVRAQSSGRPAIARNQGLRLARGRYIAFLDADDVSIPTRLESAVNALERTGALFLFADLRRLYQDTGKFADASMLTSASFLENAAAYLQLVGGNTYLCSSGFPAFLLTYVALNTPTIVFDRELLKMEKEWFDESLVRFEDVDLWYRFAEHTRFAFVNEEHSTIRKHSASITASDPVKSRIDGITVQSRHFERLRPRMSPDEIAAAAQHISELQFHVAYANRCAGNAGAARRWYRASWRTLPTSAALLGYIKSFLPAPRHAPVPEAIGTIGD